MSQHLGAVLCYLVFCDQANTTKTGGFGGVRGQEGEGKHVLQNSDNLRYFLWAILLEQYFEKSRLLNRFLASQSIEVKSW